MIRIYFDWNALAGLKNHLLKDLEQLIHKNEFRFSFFYSTAHIGDIYKSFKLENGLTSEIISDLEYLNKITGGNFFYYDKPKVKLDRRDAIQIFKDRILTEQWGADFFDLATKNKEDPIKSDNADSSRFYNIVQSAQKDHLNTTLTIFKDIFSSDLYKDLRETFQQGLRINRDQMYNDPAPINKLNKIFSKSYLHEKSFSEIQGKLLKDFGNIDDDWYCKITNSYIILDMAGYKEDKINASENNTYYNTVQDAFHTSFASQCDFYVTSDKRNLSKAKQVYEYLGINTIALTPQELLLFLSEYIEGINTRHFMEDVLYKINNWKRAGHDPKNENRYTIWFKSFVLDYFNKAYYFKDVLNENGEQTWMIILTKEKPTNGRFTFITDISILISKLEKLLGNNENNLKLSETEIESLLQGRDWSGRSWAIGNLFIRFRSINGYFQLYISSIKLNDLSIVE
jgi:hypothetical protein